MAGKKAFGFLLSKNLCVGKVVKYRYTQIILFLVEF